MAAYAFLLTYLFSVTEISANFTIYLNEINLTLGILDKLEELIYLLLRTNLAKYLCLSLIFLILAYLFKHSALLWRLNSNMLEPFANVSSKIGSIAITYEFFLKVWDFNRFSFFNRSPALQSTF